LLLLHRKLATAGAFRPAEEPVAGRLDDVHLDMASDVRLAFLPNRVRFYLCK
jgi:hypothetical protein